MASQRFSAGVYFVGQKFLKIAVKFDGLSPAIRQDCRCLPRITADPASVLR